MTRGQVEKVKVHYKGENDDFIVMVDSKEAVENYKKDKTNSIPLADVVSGFKVFVTHKHGSQGVLDGASNGAMEDEFQTSNVDEVIKIILHKGELVKTEFAGRDGGHNAARGDRGI